jgi:hypothetical protein
MGQALNDSLAKEATVAHQNMEGLAQSIMQRQLRKKEKRKRNEIVKEALKEARRKSLGGKKDKKSKRHKQRNGELQNEQSKDSASPTQPPKHPKKKHSNNPDTGNIRNGSIGSRTLTGAKAHHTCLLTSTTIRLDRARWKDVVAAPAKTKEAPAEVEEEGADGPK